MGLFRRRRVALVIAALIGVPASELNHRTFAAHPLAVRINERYYVRAIQQVHDDGSLSFYCAVENGIVLTAMTPGPMLPNLEQLFDGLQERGVCHCFVHHQGNVTLDRLVARHGLGLRHVTRQHGVQREFEQHRSLGQFVRLAPFRVQFTHMANALLAKPDTGRTAGVHGWMLGRAKRGMPRRQQGLDVAFGIKEVHHALRQTPLQSV